MECIAEADLFDLAHARRRLGDAPDLEAHLADCAACSALLCTLLDVPDDRPSRDLTGRTLGPYRLDGLIGAGAMGEVYRGWDLRLLRPVAVKVLSRSPGEVGERARRLEAEGRAAAAITHPNVVTIYDTGTEDGVPYVVSELVAGESLRSRISRAPIPRDSVIALALQLARGLAAAHAQGVVHRDLKPENLIVCEDGTLKILDFGLAKLAGDRDADATEPGTLLGTSGYLAPEQARGEPADARSDLFAVGAIVQELVTGQRAFGGATFAERLSATLRDMPPPIEDPIGPIVLRCLDKDPRKRFQSANDLAWVIERLPGVIGSPSVPVRKGVSRRAFLAGAAATGLGGVVLGRARMPARTSVVPSFHQLTFRQGRVASARFTGDGGSLVYGAAWEDHSTTLFITRLGGGGTRPLALPPAHLLAVSAHGQLALSLDHRSVDGFHQHGTLALAPLEGGEPRALGIDVQHADFTPDSSALAIVRRFAGRFRLELPAGNVLLEAGWLSHPRVSPDGRLIACFGHDGPGDDGGDLVVVPRTGGTARTIAAGWSSIDGLAWVRGGKALWVSASRLGGNNLVFALALDGRELAQVPSAGRLRVNDLAADGRMALTHVSGRLRLMARPPGATEERELGLADVSLVGDLSADGTTVVFTELGDVDTANGAYIRPTSGGPAVLLGAAVPCDLAEDGRGVLAMPRRGSLLAAYPIPAGQPQPIAVPGLRGVRWARWCSAGRILLAGALPGRPPRLWRLDPGGRLTPLGDEGMIDACDVSGDGEHAALIANDRLLVIAIAGGAPRVVPGTFGDASVCGWSRSGEC
ncbi:MAG: serine/threonine-protein kinase [Kofleriaceae bacterium]